MNQGQSQSGLSLEHQEGASRPLLLTANQQDRMRDIAVESRLNQNVKYCSVLSPQLWGLQYLLPQGKFLACHNFTRTSKLS